MTMNIDITREQLEKYVPSMVVSSDDIFNELSDYFVRARIRLELISGVDIISSPSTDLMELCRRYVCQLAVYEYIPQRDLVITPNGFGVVSDANIAPASKERVENLRHRLAVDYYASLGEVIDAIRNIRDASWEQSLAPARAVPHLVYNARHLSMYCSVPEPTEQDYVSRIHLILDAENDIIHEIGYNQFSLLLTAARCASYSVNQLAVIRKLRCAIGQHVQGMPKAASMEFIRQAVNMMKDVPSDFPAYFDSPEYRAKSVNYENGKEDSCYFF